jgi:hypothetical protein
MLSQQNLYCSARKPNKTHMARSTHQNTYRAELKAWSTLQEGPEETLPLHFLTTVHYTQGPILLTRAIRLPCCNCSKATSGC